MHRAKNGRQFRSQLDSAVQALLVSRSRPELVKAQLAAFNKQVPVLYAMLLINTWILGIGHLGAAPIGLVVIWPAVLTAVCIVRMIQWLRTNEKSISSEKAVTTLSRMNVLAPLLAVGFSTWALSLYPYGSEAMRAHIAFYMAITVIGCIFCLTNLLSAAFAVTVVVNGVFVAFFIGTGHPTYAAMGFNVLLVTGVLLYIASVNYRDFSSLVESRRTLVESEAKAISLSEENLRLANLDSLTALPNRRSFFSSLDAAVESSIATGDKVIIGILDLDGFKPVNDTHGHAVGDSLLRKIAERLLETCLDGVSVFRLGGDEFALICGVHDVADAMRRANLICAALRAPIVLPSCTTRVSGTMGMAVFPDMAKDAHELYERADYAMYRAKRGGGRGNARLFTSQDELEIKRDSTIEQALKAADLEAELQLMYQPIVDAESRRTVGFEALARWKSPILGSVSSGEFIPVAERSGLITDLTAVLLRKALVELASWPSVYRLSFNMSVFDLLPPGHLLRLIGIIGTAGIDPRRIDFEITETAMMTDFEAVAAAVETLKGIGVGISIDDFGTGYSSLRQVHQLPLDKLKIDRSFVSGIDSNPASRKIVKSLISLCEDLGIDCVVEGVETEEELAAVRELGCHLVQGYVYSAPMLPFDVHSRVADADAGETHWLESGSGP